MEERARFRLFCRMYVRREREMYREGEPTTFGGPGMFREMLLEMERLIRHPRFGPPFVRMLERLSMISASTYGTTT